MDFPYEINREGDRYFLDVPGALRKKAERQVRLYEREMAGKKRDLAADAVNPESSTKVNLPAFFSVPFLFYVFQMIQLAMEYVPWNEAGYSSADLVLKGEWWRAVTALTLHADEGHFIGNLITGGLIVFFLSAATGEGLAWALVFLSGILGNFLNAFIYQTGHNSIGFSTAVFGAIGVLTGLELFRKGKKHWRRIVFPLGGGLALFGLFGTGPGTDISAHLMGLLCGMAIGLVCRIFLDKTKKPELPVQVLLVFANTGFIALCWFIALFSR
jgi:membrane associated rhomboid family serine protease